MNNKTKVGPSRYVPPSEEHVTKWERFEEWKVGRVILTKGRSVKISGVRAATFEFQYAERNRETGKVILTVVGGHAGHRMTRSFEPERVSKVLRW